ncbi:sarcosine oxidase subunit delta [Pseudohoeflea coraliihabitans]|uniref:Sarcosine oxidase subunit delta n=1 Tax=Pseudohoeflea coraliihabitans TaxID=2860393 RepID=A0ABS6WLR1_9HYPH|nr:sarcosine oxidase subunit delta [Pseudohoeflea sp. DP4N28-3]MBW3096357.1 sarcosine oxidase subunit delta [Pseudohoeflea sp. DP4N28-3]
MLLIACPYCGEERPELEFRHAGEAHVARPDPIAEIDDAAFEAFFFLRDNPKGLIWERWRHVHGCGRFFNAVRDTVSDRFITTYKAGEVRREVVRDDEGGYQLKGEER